MGLNESRDPEIGIGILRIFDISDLFEQSAVKDSEVFFS